MRVLCVAEKPSIAKSISGILSGGQHTTSNTGVPWIKNYEFDYPRTNSRFIVTSVSGHLFAHEFSRQFKNWKSCDPFALFDAPIEVKVPDEGKAIADNLKNQAVRCDQLMIWTDCDREGENIGAEVMSVCRSAKRNITVKRARFSAIIANQIHNAAQNPVELDMAQAAAVEARTNLDLRLGAAFTRMQTLALQGRIPEFVGRTISYGPCQFPTLGFVVSKYKEVESFVPETFWYIQMNIERRNPETGRNEETKFTWKRGRLFDFPVSLALYEYVMESDRARVTKVEKKETKKWKPLPLTTVELQKSGSRLLRMTPKKILDVAEKLYQSGWLSYPRTETDQFDPQFDHKALVEKQRADPAWGGFATRLMTQEGQFEKPRNGRKNDQAHPPIHPTAHVQPDRLNAEEKKVYEYITRRYLASCSLNALGMLTTVDVAYGGEEFYATGLVVLERNYLDVFTYDKWNDNFIPSFEEGEEFTPSVCLLLEGKTTSPTLLTEADLVGLMDKNGIGTDATIATHIQTIADREYVIKRQEGNTTVLVPSTLGIGLVEGYNRIGYERSLSKPQLRRETERRMVQVCQGTKSKNEMLQESIDQYKHVYLLAKGNFDSIVQSVMHYTRGQPDPNMDSGDDSGGNDGGGGGGGEGRGRGRGRGNPRGRGNGGGSRRGQGGRGGGRQPSESDGDDSTGGNPPPPPRRRPATTATIPSSNSTAHGTLCSSAPTVVESSDSVQLCHCNLPALVDVVTEDTPNKGRKHWTCHYGNDGCGYFDWLPTHKAPTSSSWPTQTPGAGPSGGGYAAGNSDCYVCKQPGHFAKDCTQKSSGSGTRAITCYFCKGEGHFANVCPKKDPSRQTGGPTTGTRQTEGECFNCHKTGHWASDCPSVRSFGEQSRGKARKPPYGGYKTSSSRSRGTSSRGRGSRKPSGR